MITACMHGIDIYVYSYEIGPLNILSQQFLTIHSYVLKVDHGQMIAAMLFKESKLD